MVEGLTIYGMKVASNSAIATSYAALSKNVQNKLKSRGIEVKVFEATRDLGVDVTGSRRAGRTCQDARWRKASKRVQMANRLQRTPPLNKKELQSSL